MKRFIFPALVLCLILGFASFAAAATEVVEAALAGDVVDRQPAEQFVGPGGDQIPVVTASNVDRIYYWTKVSATEDVVLVHTWYIEEPTDAADGPTLKEVAAKELNIRQSTGWRTWSYIQVFENMPTGTWRVNVTALDDPQELLSSQRFVIE